MTVKLLTWLEAVSWEGQWDKERIWDHRAGLSPARRGASPQGRDRPRQAGEVREEQPGGQGGRSSGLNGTGKQHELEGLWFYLPGTASSCWTHHTATTTLAQRRAGSSQQEDRKAAHPEAPLALTLPAILLPALCAPCSFQLPSTGTCRHRGSKNHPVSLGQLQVISSRHSVGMGGLLKLNMPRAAPAPCVWWVQGVRANLGREGEGTGERLKEHDRSRAGSSRLSGHVTLKASCHHLTCRRAELLTEGTLQTQLGPLAPADKRGLCLCFCGPVTLNPAYWHLINSVSKSNPSLPAQCCTQQVSMSVPSELGLVSLQEGSNYPATVSSSLEPDQDCAWQCTA